MSVVCLSHLRLFWLRLNFSFSLHFRSGISLNSNNIKYVIINSWLKIINKSIFLSAIVCSIHWKKLFAIGQLMMLRHCPTNRCRLNLASFVRIAQSSLVASICMSPESRTNRNTSALRSNRCHRSHRNERFYCRRCYWIVPAMDRPMRQMLTMLRHDAANIVDKLGNLERAGHWSMLWLTSGNRPCSDRIFRQRACWPNVAMTNNHHPSNDNVIASIALPQRFVWNSLRRGFGRHIATILDSFWRTQV